MATNPKASVVLPVYNGEAYLREAIDSILAQTMADFELVIINDGSTDSTAKILKSYQDDRINIISRPNKGLVASLNEGIRAARAPLIIRHDADDRSAPDRFALQVSYMAQAPHCVLLGSSMAVMDETSQILHHHAVLLHDAELRQELLVRSPFAHGSVVFRRQAAIDAGLYRQAYWPAEDYDFWLRLSAYGTLANLDTYAYVYRENNQGISAKRQKEQLTRSQQVRHDAWQQRSRLLSGPKIHLRAYLNTDMAEQRIGRIMANINEVHRQAIHARDFTTALRNARLLPVSRLTARKVAGSLKRKLRP